MSKEKDENKKKVENRVETKTNKESSEIKQHSSGNSLPQKSGRDLSTLIQFIQSEFIDVRNTIEESKNEIKTVYERMDSLNEQFIKDTVVPLEQLNQREEEKFDKLQADYEVLVDVLKTMNEKITSLKNDSSYHASWQSVYDLQTELQTTNANIVVLGEDLKKTKETINEIGNSSSVLESEIKNEKKKRKTLSFVVLVLFVASLICGLVF